MEISHFDQNGPPYLCLYQFFIEQHFDLCRGITNPVNYPVQLEGRPGAPQHNYDTNNNN